MLKYFKHNTHIQYYFIVIALNGVNVQLPLIEWLLSMIFKCISTLYTGYKRALIVAVHSFLGKKKIIE